jgi:hypothetical protein
MGAELLQLVADIFVYVLEGVEEGGSDGGGSGAILDSGAQILLGGVHQSTISVIDDHEFLGAQQIVRDDQGAQGIVGDDAAGVADDVGVSGLQAQSADGKAGIHTGQHGELALGARGQPAQLVRAGVDFVCGEDFVDDAHGRAQCTLGDWNLGEGDRGGWRKARKRDFTARTNHETIGGCEERFLLRDPAAKRRAEEKAGSLHSK